MAFNFGSTGTAFGAARTATAGTSTPFGAFGAKTTASTSAFGFGTATTSSGAFGGFKGFGTTATTTSGSTLFGGFGTTPATSTGGLFSGFGTAAKTTGSSLFGGFGTTTTTASSGFGFGGSGLFGGQSTGFGTAGASTGFGTGLTGTGFGAIGSTQQQQQQQQQQQLNLALQAASNPAAVMVTALTLPVVFGDERDAILAKFNQLQALYGQGKGYYSQSQPPVQFTTDNPFCRFKTICYSCLPNAKDEDGLIALELKHNVTNVKQNQQQFVESLNKLLGNKPTLVVCIEQVREIPGNRTEVIFYIVERAPNGTTRKIPATQIYAYLNQANHKMALQNLGAENMLPKTSLTETQLKQFLENPPLGIDPIIWEQAKKDNPDPEKLIPVPVVGFSELSNRLKHQEHQTEQHQKRLNIIADEIGELQRSHATTVAKLAQYKRKHLELGHRILEAMIRQESTRKMGYAIEPDEEQLRIKLESIHAELNSPMHFKPPAQMNLAFNMKTKQTKQEVPARVRLAGLDVISRDFSDEFPCSDAVVTGFEQKSNPVEEFYKPVKFQADRT